MRLLYNRFAEIYLGLSLLLLLPAVPPTYAQAGSTFDTDAEGWEAVTFPVRGPYATPLATPPLTHHTDGGNPGGYVEIEDPDNDVVFWQAPDAFLGDQSNLYGGTLTFDLRNSAPIDYTDDFDVVLRGAGLTLLIEVEPPTQGTWTSYSVGLREDFTGRSPWRVGDEDGEPPTPAEFQSVLAALESLLIRAEHSNTVSGEFMGLDNPALALGPTAVEPGASDRGGLVLTSVYPHPLRDTGTLHLTADRMQTVRIELFDVLGRRVDVVFEGVLAAGETTLPLRTAHLPAGLYVVRVHSPDALATRRVTVGG